MNAYRCGACVWLADRPWTLLASLLMPTCIAAGLSTRLSPGLPRRMPRRMSTRAPLVLLALLAFSAVLQASDGFESERLDLVCVEQPMRAVSFGAPGELSYGEQPPKESDPVDVLVTKSRPGEDFNYDFARIESSAEDLETEEAIWLTGKQIEAQQGRFKINLENLMMTLTENEADGSARFRRFECRKRVIDEATAD